MGSGTGGFTLSLDLLNVKPVGIHTGLGGTGGGGLCTAALGRVLALPTTDSRGAVFTTLEIMGTEYWLTAGCGKVSGGRSGGEAAGGGGNSIMGRSALSAFC